MGAPPAVRHSGLGLLRLASSTANPAQIVWTVRLVSPTLPLNTVIWSNPGDGSTGSYAERDITYLVDDQYQRQMPGVKIQERLQPASGTPCPGATTLQSGAAARVRHSLPRCYNAAIRPLRW